MSRSWSARMILAFSTARCAVRGVRGSGGGGRGGGCGAGRAGGGRGRRRARRRTRSPRGRRRRAARLPASAACRRRWPGRWRGRARCRGWPAGGPGTALGPVTGAAGAAAGWRPGPVTGTAVEPAAGCGPGLGRRAGRLSLGCRARRREDGPGADHVRVGPDGLPVGRVQGLPAAGHPEGDGDGGQGVARRDGVPGRALPSRDRQDGTGVDDVRVGPDGLPVGRVQGLPAAGHAQGRGDGGQGVTGPHGPRRGGPRPAAGGDFGVHGGHGLAGPDHPGVTRGADASCGSDASCRAGASCRADASCGSDASCGADAGRGAGVRLGQAGLLGAGHCQKGQDAPGEHHARGRSPLAHDGASSFLGIGAGHCWPGAGIWA